MDNLTANGARGSDPSRPAYQQQSAGALLLSKVLLGGYKALEQAARRHTAPVSPAHNKTVKSAGMAVQFLVLLCVCWISQSYGDYYNPQYYDLYSKVKTFSLRKNLQVQALT